MSAWTSPFCTWRFTPLRMGLPSTLTWRSLISSSGFVMISRRGRELLLVDLDAFAKHGEAQERALQAHGADGDAEHGDDRVAVDLLDLGEGLALDAAREERSARLGDGAAAARELDVRDLVLLVDEERQADLVAAERVVRLVVHARALDHAEVARVLVVVEDVLAVHVFAVHSRNTFRACSRARTSASTSSSVL